MFSLGKLSTISASQFAPIRRRFREALIGFIFPCVIIGPADADERRLAEMDDLAAFVSEPSWCGPSVSMKFVSPRSADFVGDRVPVQRLMAAVGAILGFECAEARRVEIDGVSGGQVVYRGFSEANQGWVLQTAENVPPPAAPTPSEQELAFEVQDRLNLLGYDAGPVDGRPGKKTRAAISAFQLNSGMTPDGVISAELVAALRQAGGAAENQVVSATSATPPPPTVAETQAAANTGHDANICSVMASLNTAPIASFSAIASSSPVLSNCHDSVNMAGWESATCEIVGCHGPNGQRAPASALAAEIASCVGEAGQEHGENWDWPYDILVRNKPSNLSNAVRIGVVKNSPRQVCSFQFTRHIP